MCDQQNLNVPIQAVLQMYAASTWNTLWSLYSNPRYGVLWCNIRAEVTCA